MKLHWSPRSPSVRKIMIAAHEAGLQDRFEKVRTLVAPDNLNAGLMRENPLNKLPTLVLDDGSILYDSRVIAEYFDLIADGKKLLPRGGMERITALRYQALGDGMLDVLLGWLGEGFRPKEMQYAKLIDAYRTKIETCVDKLESEVDVLNNLPFGIGQICIGVALSYIDFRFASLNWRNGHPLLQAWHAEFTQRPSVLANEVVDDL